jgi:glycosyltransferase involved in cell wall biosynthesis
MGVHGAVYYGGRNVVNSVQKRFLPGPKHAFRKASGGIIAATEGIRREIRRWYGQESEVICEIGLPPTAVTETSARESGEPLRLAWSGRHQPAKGLPLLLRAATLLPEGLDWELEILGDGPCTRKWHRLAGRLGVDGRCRWHGWIARDEALRVINRAHLFVVTSLKELTSTVVIEALAQGLPVVCPDHCGFADAVTVACGVKLPIDSPSRFQAELTRAIARLAGDEPERRRLAAGAIRRAPEFSWERKAEAVDRIYRRVLAKAAGEECGAQPTVIATE